MSIPVVADADTLFGAATHGLLLHLDVAKVIHPHWSPLILDEMRRAPVKTGRKPDIASPHVLEAVMARVCPMADIDLVTVQAQFRAIFAGTRSAEDMHVSACARAVVAEAFYSAPLVVALVTKNLSDYVLATLQAVDARVSHLDAATPRPPERLLDKLSADGQVKAATAMRLAFAMRLIEL